MRVVSGDIATTSAAADAALCDMSAADGDEVNGTGHKKCHLLLVF